MARSITFSLGVNVIPVSAATYTQRWRTTFLVNISLDDFVITVLYSSVFREFKLRFKT